jgi:hypothetical protein
MAPKVSKQISGMSTADILSTLMPFPQKGNDPNGEPAGGVSYLDADTPDADKPVFMDASNMKAHMAGWLGNLLSRAPKKGKISKAELGAMASNLSFFVRSTPDGSRDVELGVAHPQTTESVGPSAYNALGQFRLDDVSVEQRTGNKLGFTFMSLTFNEVKNMLNGLPKDGPQQWHSAKEFREMFTELIRRRTNGDIDDSDWTEEVIAEFPRMHSKH